MPQRPNNIWKSRRLTLLLVALDAAALCLLWLGVWRLRRALDPLAAAPINDLDNYLRALPGLLVGWLVVLAFYGHYAHRERVSSLNQVSRVIKASLWLLWVNVFFAYFLYRSLELGRSIVLASAVAFLVWLYVSRSILRLLKSRSLARGEGARRALVVGATPLGRRVIEHLKDHPEIGFRVAGCVRTGGDAENGMAEVPVLGGLADLGDLIARHGIDEVFWADPTTPGDEVLNTVVEHERSGAEFKFVSDDFFRVMSGDAILDSVEGIPVTRLGTGRLSTFDAWVKRALDLVVVIGLAPLWVPTWLVIALVIWIEDGRPVLFVHRRVGLDGREFRLLKFRTMRVETDPYAPAPTDPGDPRVTRVGRFLRRTSLDELPQFWNVLVGDMSMVGPRPEMPFLVAKYAEWQRARLDVKPGLTGLWQVVGRKNLPLEWNIEYDLWYVRNRTFLMDVEILFKTIPAVLFGKGAF